jgi:hypothetical protein
MTGPFTEADVKAALKITWPAVYTERGFVCVDPLSLQATMTLLNAAYRSASSRDDGWVACPKEPTTETDIAARDWSQAKYGKPIGNDASQGVYRAMLAASPYAIKEFAPSVKPSAAQDPLHRGWEEDDLGDNLMGG